MEPIDRTRAATAFERYTSAFDPSDERIALKIFHTFRVAENCDRLASALCLPKEDRDEAWLIGLLHDIGRFEQCSRARSFLDSASFDHAEEGVRYLFSCGHVADFLPEEGEGNTELLDELRLAVKYHNKFALPEGLTVREQLFCHLIRDADKLDIFRVSTVNAFAVVHEYPEETVAASEISPAVVACFEDRTTLDYRLRRTPADIFLGHIAMCFGLHFPVSRALAREQGYVAKMMNFRFTRPESEAEYRRLRRLMEEFLSEA